MPPKVVITFEGILLLIRKIVLHLMVDSTINVGTRQRKIFVRGAAL